MRRRPSVAIGVFGLSVAQAFAAGQTDRELRFNEAYLASPARQANAASASGASMVRDALQGQTATIPAGWRLVSVLPRGSGFLMFFQEPDGSVRSLGVEASGALSGNDTLWLRSHR